MISAEALNSIITTTFSHPDDVDYEEGYCVIWGAGFSKWLNLEFGLTGIPYVLYSDMDAANEFPEFCDHCTVFIPELNITVDWRGLNAKERWENPTGLWRNETWDKVLLDVLDEHYKVFTRLCDTNLVPA